MIKLMSYYSIEPLQKQHYQKEKGTPLLECLYCGR